MWIYNCKILGFGVWGSQACHTDKLCLSSVLDIGIISQTKKEVHGDISYAIVRNEYKGKFKKLEKENNHLHKIIDKFYETVEKFIDWVCHRFGIREAKQLIKDFEEQTNTFIVPVKQLDFEEKQKRIRVGFRNITTN